MTPLDAALGWALLHSLWQGAIVALSLVVVMFLFRSPRIRYASGCAALLLTLAGFIGTLLLVTGQDPSGAESLQTAPRLVWREVAFLPGVGHPVSPLAIVPWLAPPWIAGVCLLSLWRLVGWAAVSRLRRRGVCLAPDPWVRKLRELAVRLRVTRPVQLLESGLAGTPAVLGHLRPAILMPLGLLAGLPADQVEAILLHELAHVARCDYLVNLLQQLVECLLFYHPCVWWISGVIREEREHCCDDLVIQISGDAHSYAMALASLEQNRLAGQPAMAATGGNLMKRIRRLLYPQQTNPAGWPAAAVFGLLIVTAAGALAWQGRPAPAAQTNSNSPYLTWLNQDVVYIIEAAERTAFLSLTTDAERDHFIEQFWLRRDPTPGTPENEFKIEHYRRIGYVNEHFAGPGAAGWQTDRGHVYIVYGPPDELESHPRGDAAEYPHEDWLYRHIDGFGDNHVFRFVDRSRNADYRLQ